MFICVCFFFGGIYIYIIVRFANGAPLKTHDSESFHAVDGSRGILQGAGVADLLLCLEILELKA